MDKSSDDLPCLPLCQNFRLLLWNQGGLCKALTCLYSNGSELSSSQLQILITILWITSAAIASPRLYYFGTIKIPLGNHQKDTICIPKKTLYDSATADTIYFVLVYVFPLTVITILYARIAKHLHRSVALRQGLSETGQGGHSFSSHRLASNSVRHDAIGNICIQCYQPRRKSNSGEKFACRNRSSSSSSSSISISGGSAADISKQTFKVTCFVQHLLLINVKYGPVSPIKLANCRFAEKKVRMEIDYFQT